MTPTIPGFRLRKGLKPGAPHVRREINCQDFADVRSCALGDRTFVMGFLSDGCSGENPKRSHTEVAAKLLVTRALVETRMLLLAGVPVGSLNAPLYSGLVHYLRSLAHLTYPGLSHEGEFLDFVGNILMATLLGFVTDGEQILILRSGDGVKVVNQTQTIVHEASPIYLGYHVLSAAQLQRITAKAGKTVVLPQAFDEELLPLTSVNRLALCSDGILRRVDGEEVLHPEDVEGVFNYQPDAPAGLQWYLNKRAQQLPFDDDCSVLELSRTATQ